MAEKQLKSIKFPGLEDTYVIPEGGNIDIDLEGANEGEITCLKPQSPLQHKDGDYFYPLTTIDQVIMEDGSRLSSVDFTHPIPIVNNEDNGKFLRVVNGVWTAVALQYAEEVSV